MPVEDPRDAYDDLITTERREELSPETFADHASSEAMAAGWVVVAYVFDDAGRVLLVDEPWADGWKSPAGTHKPGESLPETLRREVREETGIEARPGRPHAAETYTAVNADTGETASMVAVGMAATAETTTIAADPGVDGETIEDVRWFTELPPTVFNPDVTEPVYRRCLEEHGSR
ncbi:hypothetical protein JCM17823_22590 [Halorubrum gandharaense]